MCIRDRGENRFDSMSAVAVIGQDGLMDSSAGPRAGGPRPRRSFTAREKLAHLVAYEAACADGAGGGAATRAVRAGRLVRHQVSKLLPGGERPPRSRATRTGASRGIHQAILADHSNSRHRIEPVLALRQADLL